MPKWLFAVGLCLGLIGSLGAGMPANAQAADKPSDVLVTRLQVPAFDRAFQRRVIDLSQMDVINSGSFSGVGDTCLHHDRWLRNLGYGDLAWSDATQQWIAFRGARLIALDQGDPDSAARIPTSELKSRFEKEGSVVLSLDDAHCLAIRTAEGHLAVLKISKRNQKAALDIDIHRLTTDEPFRNEQPSDRLAGAAWGPVVDGFQAGLAFRSPGPKDNWQRTVGESVPVKVFVRNASGEAKTYSWQQFSEKDARRMPPSRVPLLVAWRPQMTDSAGKPLTIAPPADSYLDIVQHQTTLQPGEWVLIGAAAIALWPTIDVGFGAASDRQTAVAVGLGDYRLSAEVDTGLVSRSRLRTGTLSLSVIENQQRIDALRQLDSIASQGERARETGWQDAAMTTRPALGAVTVDYLALPCLVRDAQTKQPIAGATARVEVAAWGEHSFHKLCEYNLVTDVEGRFVMQIPQRLLSGFQKGCRADYRVHVTHPQYGEVFKSQTLASLQELGLIAKDGSVLKQGQQPAQADEGSLAEIQEIALPPARTLSGRLLGKDGMPLHDVPIYCNGTEGFMVIVGSPKSDMEGRFRFNVPAKQTVKLEFRTAEFGRNYTTATADQTDLGDIRAVQGTKVRGQIFDAAGVPIAGIRANTPSFPDETAQPNFVYTTDANGWFTTDVLAPGEYQAVVGALRTSDSGGAELVGPPPDLYLPVRFKVQSHGSVADLTLRPAPATQVTVTLISSVPATSEGESPHVLDRLFWQVTMEKSNRERAKQ
ncbi:MAG TPA: carboxypeptidase-like regulatory domain-containing protein, partial [Schlesneria sp.]